jgi:hypothetical protein
LEGLFQSPLLHHRHLGTLRLLNDFIHPAVQNIISLRPIPRFASRVAHAANTGVSSAFAALSPLIHRLCYRHPVLRSLFLDEDAPAAPPGRVRRRTTGSTAATSPNPAPVPAPAVASAAPVPVPVPVQSPIVPPQGMTDAAAVGGSVFRNKFSAYGPGDSPMAPLSYVNSNTHLHAAASMTDAGAPPSTRINKGAAVAASHGYSSTELRNIRYRLQSTGTILRARSGGGGGGRGTGAERKRQADTQTNSLYIARI